MRRLLAAIASSGACGRRFAQFDHRHAAWNELLTKHVRT